MAVQTVLAPFAVYPWMLRLAAQWRGMVTVIVGILLAAMVAAAMPLYTAVMQIGMVERLDDKLPQSVNILVRTGLPAKAVGSNYSPLDSVVRATVPEIFDTFGVWQDEIVAFTETSELFVLADGVEYTGFKAKLAAYDGIEARIEWEGHAPQNMGDGSTNGYSSRDYCWPRNYANPCEHRAVDHTGLRISLTPRVRFIALLILGFK